MSNTVCVLRRFFVIPIALGYLVFSSSLFAQQTSRLSPQKMAAVMSVINMLLQEEEPKFIELGFGALDKRRYSIRDEFEITFPRQAQNLEFCFVLSRYSASSGLTLTINGNAQSIQNGENCFVIPSAAQSDTNSVTLSFNGGKGFAQIRLIDVAQRTQSRLGLSSLTRSSWDERAVRKVLKIFAFGGHARDAQIIEWASMPPRVAINEMLNFSEHNLKLSPLIAGERYRDVVNQPGTLKGFLEFLSSESSNLPIPASRTNSNGTISYPREQYGLDGYNFDDGYGRMITVRGLNPFRQRIGFWETNFHLAVNRDAGVSRRQIAQYYDEIMEAHESGIPYHEVMGVAAKSAAIAVQYGHLRNEWIPVSRNSPEYYCKCNEDFAREIHQLFYGIFGEGDPNHENGTIKETAKMLTDMRVPYIQDFGSALTVTFETDQHHTGSLMILGQTISGGNASQKIDNLMPISMAHPEARENLPIMIVSTLADDNLNEIRKQQLRSAWAALGPNKNFLEFIHSYATSSLFHGPNQAKFFTSHERALYLANKNNLDNFEAYFGGGGYNGGRAGRSVGGVISSDDAGEFFRPLHNVFGAQNSFEAADSALVFEKNYNELTDFEERMRDRVQCDSCDLGQPWDKKWPSVLPKRADGQYYVADVAAWLWNHAVGNFDNYTDLEKAHLYTLLAAARSSPGRNYDNDHAFDFNLLMCLVEDYQAKEPGADISLASLMTESVWNDYCRENDDGGEFTATEIAALNRVYTGESIANNSTIQGLLSQMGQATLPLTTTTGANGGADLREHARERVNSALGFIFTTPFIFAEGQ